MTTQRLPGIVLADVAPKGAAPGSSSAHRGRLFRKYLLLILSLVTIALLASGAIGIYFSYQENRSALGSLQHEKAVAAASRIEQYVIGIEQQLKYAALPQLGAGEVDLRRIEFLKLLRQVPEITDIAQVNGAGREQVFVSRLGMDNINSGKDRSQEPAFRGAKRGQTWFGPVYFRKETEPYLTIALRSSGDDAPVTIADVNLKFIWDVVSRIKIGEKGKAYVVDRNGFLVADPDIGLVLRKTDLSALPHVKAAADASKADEAAMESTDLSGTRMLTSVAFIEPLGWRVFVEQPVSEVYASLNASIVRTGLLLLAGLVLSAFGALALARGMVRPIRTLDEGARRIGAGDLDQQIEVRTGDELQGLAEQFNRMTVQLRESYAGLERKVDDRTRALQNTLEQQTAISEILRVISSSPTDVQPVLQAVAERAAHLCGAPFARVMVLEGDVLYPTASYSTEPGFVGNPVPVSRTSITGRAVVERATVHFADVAPIAETEFPDALENIRRLGCRAALGVPLLREGGAYGGIFLFRRTPGLFSPDQVALVETFARQAAIAIDNVRLFNETKEALEQQQASAEVLSVISSSVADTAPVFERITKSCKHLFEGDVVRINLVGEDGLVHVGYYDGPNREEFLRIFPAPLGPESSTGIAILERRIVHYSDVEHDPDVPEYTRRAAAATGTRSIVYAPMVWEGRGIGVVAVARSIVQPFSDKEIALLKTFADQAVIAIQNARLFNETKEALDQQTAVAEILRVISSSPTDVIPVLDSIAERAAKLCDASAASMYLIEGGELKHLASQGPSADPVTHVETLPISRGSLTGRAVLERKTIQLPDLLAAASEYPLSYDIAKRFGHRTVVVTPLLREGQPFGAILLRRQDVRPFAEREIALLRTFGDQAAIALENVRLFNETKEALDQQRASGEVLAAISSSIADAKPVFEVILQSCQRLFTGDIVGVMLVRDDQLLDIGAYSGPGLDELRKMFPRPLADASASGRAILEQRIIEYPDVDAAEAPEITRRNAKIVGFRSIIAAPMISEGRGIGALWVARSFTGRFSDKQLALLRTFAEQAVIAIQNARLFNETKEALDQQRASGDVLAAISSSIADTAPVFDRILASCERLFAGTSISINVLGDDGLIHVAAHHGPRREEFMKSKPVAVDDQVATGVCINTGQVLHFPDAFDPSVPPLTRYSAGIVGAKAMVFAPMLWEGRCIGSISVGRDYAGPFSDKDIALLRTFANQAVIAIQNARLFREIQDKSRQLESANKHKSDFLANMSHELRTPLNAIIGFSEVLLERLFGDVNDKQEDYLKDIHSSGRHLLNLINDILDLSKVEAGRMELELSTFDLPSAISNAMTLIRERAQRHGIALDMDVDRQLGEIVADERKLKQILLNLLSNAVKFTPDGGRIDVSARATPSEIVISVTDTGIGIAAADQAAVFEEFRQVGDHYTSKQEGTGLGLALTRRFVELHGGTIRVNSEPGRGSTFTFTLPSVNGAASKEVVQ